MFNVIVGGVVGFLKKAFKKKEKPNKKFKDKLAEIPEERQEKIKRLTEKHKATLDKLAEDAVKLRKEKYSDDMMHMSKKGLADIVLSEAITTTRYKDSANVWTIGIGATRSEIKDLRKWENNRELSLEEVFTLFTKGIEKYSRGVRKALTVEVSQHMFDGLVSFAYNVGTGGMRNSSLIKAINRGVTDKAHLKALLMRWVKATVNGKKVKLKGLVNRRKAEAEVMFDNNYANREMEGKVVPVSGKLKPMYRSRKVQTIDLNKYL